VLAGNESQESAVKTINQRIAAEIEGDFVVFLIGARVNNLLKLPKFIPVARAMGRMVKELKLNPQLGLLHVESWFGRTTLMVQYWRSFDQLHAYARQKDAEHLPAWADFNRRIASNGDVGIWHETYLIRAGEFEGIYNNMPEFGLAGAGGWQPAEGRKRTAEGRLGRSDGGDSPL
jgi:hypothetical protein